MGMTQTTELPARLARTINEALDSKSERIGPWVGEAIFWDLRMRGFANDSGWITDAGRVAVGR